MREMLVGLIVLVTFPVVIPLLMLYELGEAFNISQNADFPK